MTQKRESSHKYYFWKEVQPRDRYRIKYYPPYKLKNKADNTRAI